MENQLGLQPQLLWTIDRWWNELPEQVWNQISDLLPTWILKATDQSVYGIHWLLNALRGKRREEQQAVSTAVGIARLINRMIATATGDYVSNWEGLVSELGQVDYATWRAWASTISTDVDLQEFDAWVAREVPQSRYLRGWVDLSQVLWTCSSHMVQVIVQELTPRLIDGLETTPVETNSDIIEWYFGFLHLLVEEEQYGEDAAEYAEEISLYRGLILNWINKVDWTRVGRLSFQRPSRGIS